MEKILIGTVIKPQGVRGEMKLMPEDSKTDIFKNIKQIYINDDNNLTVVKNLVFRQGFGYLTLNNVTDRDLAEKFRGFKIYANRDDLKLGELTYLLEDIIDADVVDEEGNFVGTLVDVENYGASDVMTIIDKDNREIDIPFLSSIVVNVEKGKITINKQKYDEVNNCESIS